MSSHVQMDIYIRVLNGDSLSDYDLEVGQPFFSHLANDLGKLGPTFRLQATECRRVADKLEDYTRARRAHREEQRQDERRKLK